MTKSTIDKEIAFTSQEYNSYTNEVDSYIMSLRAQVEDYAKKLFFEKYDSELEESIINEINELKDLRKKHFPYRTSHLAEIENRFISINEEYFDIDEPLSDDTLDGRLVLK